MILCSCSSGNNIFFITDIYTKELLKNNNIIEEFRKAAGRRNFDFSVYSVDSEKQLESVLDNLNRTEKDRVVLTSFAYVNYFPDEKMLKDNIYLVGPYFDFDRGKVEIKGNISTVSAAAVEKSDFSRVLFYTDAGSSSSFPEKEISESIVREIEKYNGKKLSVAYYRIDSLKSSGFTDEGGDVLTVIVPESLFDIVSDKIREIKNSFLVYDFADFTAGGIFLTLTEQFSVIKYDYQGSFETVLSEEEPGSDKKIIYSCFFEKK